MKLNITEITQIGAPENIDVLRKRINDLFDSIEISDGFTHFNKLMSPRIFRIKLGISKQTLSN